MTVMTQHGEITFPAFMPVTTFGDKYPLDRLVRPYLRRLSPCLMVSYHYALKMQERPNMPLFIDSGGFASLFDGAEIIEQGEYGCIKTRDGETITPDDVLTLQEEQADIGATLDFIITPGMDLSEARRRQEMTIRNARYALKRHSRDMMLFASLQCWDAASATRCAETYAKAGFQGIAIGGMVPRLKNPAYIEAIVRAVRGAAPHCLIHVFGIGSEKLIPTLIRAGADSFDSSSYVRSAVDAQAKGTGIHTGIYAAVKNLYEINGAVTGSKGSITRDYPNYSLYFQRETDQNTRGQK